MEKKVSYTVDILAYLVLSIVTAIYSYSNLIIYEKVENEYTVFTVYSFDTTREFVGYIIMALATLFLFHYIFKKNMEFVNLKIGTTILKEVLMLIGITMLVVIYTIAPYVLMVSAPNQVIFTNAFSEILKNITYFAPFVFYIIMLIVMIILKIFKKDETNE